MKIKAKSAKVARLVPRGATMLKCDRCDVSYPSCPSGRFDDGVHLTAVSNPAAGLTQAFGSHGGVPDGNLCAPCMNSFIYWWVSASHVKGLRERELRDYENGETHPDIDEIEEQIITRRRRPAGEQDWVRSRTIFGDSSRIATAPAP